MLLFAVVFTLFVSVDNVDFDKFVGTFFFRNLFWVFFDAGVFTFISVSAGGVDRDDLDATFLCETTTGLVSVFDVGVVNVANALLCWPLKFFFPFLYCRCVEADLRDGKKVNETLFI